MNEWTSFYHHLWWLCTKNSLLFSEDYHEIWTNVDEKIDFYEMYNTKTCLKFLCSIRKFLPKKSKSFENPFEYAWHWHIKMSQNSNQTNFDEKRNYQFKLEPEWILSDARFILTMSCIF